MLTSVLKSWRLLVPVQVALRIDDGVFLVEVVRTFLTDSIGVLREGSNTSISRTCLSF